MSSIFSKIVTGEIPCYKIAETESCLAFLNVHPLAKGHTLVIPKQEINNYFNIDTPLFNELNALSKKVAKALELAIPSEKIGVAVIGLEVPHAHIHLVPINSVSDIDFSRPKLSLAHDEMKAIADTIVSNF